MPQLDVPRSHALPERAPYPLAQGLPELGAGLGKAMREFRKATSEITNEVATATKPEPPAPSEAAKSSTSETKPTGT